ncbi:hypothetical protein PCC7418_0681 [Halothece sp. PCC 7418]|uniref:hypothetical protein n=1 Tax=Halothece sp. (strain PCC 7418) TaxID=65093 RepID=UPI0002A088FF|nr:hypothetical protein [Halothece sp. PCC 7418]AFZ42902.1 hypothetical protein PCC7418_0681 [Halothece sp. PCC 7418]
MNSVEDQKVELTIQEKIRQAEDDLVIAIQTALDQTSYGNLEDSQFRNLVRVSQTTDSPEVIKNFLRYQVGRDTKWGKGKGSLAEKIIQDIDNKLKQNAEKIAQETADEKLKPIWLELIRRYLGYGARYLKYLQAGSSQ